MCVCKFLVEHACCCVWEFPQGVTEKVSIQHMWQPWVCSHLWQPLFNFYAAKGWMFALTAGCCTDTINKCCCHWLTEKSSWPISWTPQIQCFCQQSRASWTLWPQSVAPWTRPAGGLLWKSLVWSYLHHSWIMKIKGLLILTPQEHWVTDMDQFHLWDVDNLHWDQHKVGYKLLSNGQFQ